MANGDLISADWQMQIGDLLLGDGTSYNLTKIEGLADLPPIRSGDRDRLRRHGNYPGDDFLDGRSVVVTLDIAADDEDHLATLMDELSVALAPTTDEHAVCFKVPGVAGGATTRLNARVRRKSLPLTMAYKYLLPQAVVEFYATDPRLYVNELHSASVTLASGGGGMTFPATFPLSFGGLPTGGRTNATNQGTFGSYPRFYLHGPLVNPRIANETTGETIGLDITIAQGDYLLVDTETRSVLANGTASRYSNLTVDNEWFDLEPGDNDLRLRAATATAGYLIAEWRSAYV
jgi:hypothetical protein